MSVVAGANTENPYGAVQAGGNATLFLVENGELAYVAVSKAGLTIRTKDGKFGLNDEQCEWLMDAMLAWKQCT